MRSQINNWANFSSQTFTFDLLKFLKRGIIIYTILMIILMLVVISMKEGMLNIMVIRGGARGVMVIVTGYGHGDTSSIPGQDWLHFT